VVVVTTTTTTTTTTIKAVNAQAALPPSPPSSLPPIRLSQTLEEDLIRRVVLVNRMSFDEYQQLAHLAHVVLDPFPVGGGRSSFEILAVGE